MFALGLLAVTTTVLGQYGYYDYYYDTEKDEMQQKLAGGEYVSAVVSLRDVLWRTRLIESGFLWWEKSN